MDDKNLLITAMEAGAGLCKPVNPTMPSDAAEGAPYTLLPTGYKRENLEDLLPTPVRKRATVTVNDSASFITYVQKHGLDGGSVIYADIDTRAGTCAMVAVINDHHADRAQWRDHRCIFTPKRSVEWDRWIGSNNKVMTQIEFATWLEDNISDIAAVPNMPTGAQMLDLSLKFEANGEKRVKSVIPDLQSGGVRLEFVDDETKDTRSTMEFFKRFTIGVPVFDGATSAYPIEARLKYRAKDGAVSFWYELIRIDRVFRTAITEELEKIKGATNFPILNGKP